MKLKTPLVFPGDKGFDDKRYRDYFWNMVRRTAGMPVTPKVKLDIHGFFLVDTRLKPNISIWKNCTFAIVEGSKPLLSDPPVPFQYIEEAIAAHERGEPGSGGLDGRRCLEVIQAMCYRIAKEICSLAAAAFGRLDAVVLTGGLAHSGRIVGEIAARVRFLAPLFVYPGENEMEALAAAAYEALDGRLPVQEYGR